MMDNAGDLLANALAKQSVWTGTAELDWEGWGGELFGIGCKINIKILI